MDTKENVVSAARGSGIYYHGRPEWLTDEWLAQLVEESNELRGGALLIKRQYHVGVGPVGRRLVDSVELAELTTKQVGLPGIQSGPADYLYYERPGDGIDAHLDHDQF